MNKWLMSFIFLNDYNGWLAQNGKLKRRITKHDKLHYKKKTGDTQSTSGIKGKLQIKSK
jgi:hypothetical protein